MNLSSYTTPELTVMRAKLADTLAHTPLGHLAWYGRQRDLADMDAELAKRVEKALDDFSALIKDADVQWLEDLRAITQQGLNEGRPGNFAGMLDRIDRELADHK